MYKAIVIFFMLLNPYYSDQKNNYSKKQNDNLVTVNKNSESYYKLINEAELLICNGKYENAIKTFEDAFLLVKSPFPEDIYNYIILNVYENQYDKALQFSEKLVKLGVELKFFDQTPLNRLKKYKSGWKDFTEKYNDLRNQYFNKINLDLKQELVELTQEDQKNYCGRTKRPYNPISEDSISNRLVQIFDEYGYPNHDLIGLYIYNDTILKSEYHSVILSHLFQTKFKESAYVAEFLKKEIKNLKLKPENAIKWLEDYYRPNKFYGQNSFYKLNNEIFCNKYNFEFSNYNFFDFNRHQIWAPTLKESLRKSIFKLRNPISKFIFHSVPLHKLYKSGNFKRTYKKIDVSNIDFYPVPDLLKYEDIDPNKNIDSLFNYNKLVNKGELLICNFEYKKAILKYLEAFKFSQIPFPKDILNVILCSIYSENYKLAFDYSKILIRLGIKLNFFDQIPLNQLKAKKQKWTSLVNSYSMLHNNYFSNTNWGLKEKYNLLENNLFEILKQKNYINKLNDSNIFNDYIKLIQTKGYKNFKEIGIEMENDSIIKSDDIILMMYKIFVTDSLNITKILLDEVYKGNMSPTNFVKIDRLSEQFDNKYGTPVLLKYKNNQYYILNPINKNNLKFIGYFNKNRKITFNCSYEEELQKQIFILKHKYLKFDFELPPIHDIYNLLPYQYTETFKKIDLNDY